MSIEIHVLDENDDPLFGYSSDAVPRVGECLTVQNNGKVFKVDSVE